MENCYYHSSKEAVYTCHDCSKRICDSCVIVVEGMPYCQICWDGYVAPIRQQAEFHEANLNVPWQRWQEIGILNAFWQTCKQLALQPNVFFEKIHSKSDLTTPLLFALICTLLFWFPSNLINMQLIPLVEQWNMQLLENAEDSTSAPLEGTAMAGNRQAFNAFQIFLLPLNYLFIQIIIMAWMQQALVTLFKGKAGFPATFQIRCYTMVTSIFSLCIPLLGFLITEAATIVLSIRGFQIVQRLPLKQAFFISITPALVSVFAAILTLTLSYAL